VDPEPIPVPPTGSESLPPKATPAVPATTATGAAPGSMELAEKLIHEQLQLMAHQLRMLH
jgi:hypothetical protein